MKKSTWGVLLFVGILLLAIDFWWLVAVGALIGIGYWLQMHYVQTTNHQKRNTIFTWIIVTILAFLIVGMSSGPSDSQTRTTRVKDKTTKISAPTKHKPVNSNKTKKAHKNKVKSQPKGTEQLANLSYDGTQTIDVNGGNPTFTTTDLATNHGSWQTYGNLDSHNRPTHADTLINHNMQPTTKREALTVNPTGWRNKKIKSGYLYNRSHLIGYQLTGQNNNPKNLITGTRSLNSPEMLRYEDDIAYYLKNNPNGYVRYQVIPIFKDTELVARGVHMQAQSIGSNIIHFNVYIFNIENGVKINYTDGTSQVSSAQQATSAGQQTNSNTKSGSTGQQGDINTNDTGKIVGNINSHIYHVPGQSGYSMNAANAVYFNTEQEAQAAGYRKSLR